MEREKIEAHPPIAEFYRGVPGWRVKQEQTGKSWDGLGAILGPSHTQN